MALCASMIIIGGFVRLLLGRPDFSGRPTAVAAPFALFVLTAVFGLLACDACHNQTVTDDVTTSPRPEIAGLRCGTLTVRAIADSNGPGPVRVAGGPDSATVLYAAGSVEGASLTAVELDVSLQLRDAVELVAETAGPLLPEALARAQSELAIVARQAGGRRVYFFNRHGGRGFTLVETPRLGTLDRRVGVRLVEPQTGGGIQVVSHVSGGSVVQVGRLAGSILVTRSLDVPSLLLQPEATSSPTGELVLVTVEASGSSQRGLRLREVGADARPGPSTSIADLEAGVQVEQTAILYTRSGYVVNWLVRGNGLSEVRRAMVDPETLDVRLLHPLRPDPDTGAIEAFSVSNGSDWVWTLWATSLEGSSQLWVAATDAEGRDLGRHRLRLVEEARYESPRIVPLGPGRAVFWREVAAGQTEGPVWAGLLPCGG